MDIALYSAAALSSKLSILLFLLHLLPYYSFRSLIHISVAFTTLYGLILVFQFSLSWSSTPIKRDLVIAPRSCAAPISACVALSAVNMILDFALFLLPIAMSGMYD